ncbi:hypothetical protein DsansV1_C19g0156931 [Dioscorea sansibarensis]
MADAFLPNQDDGELWLPSDLYPDVEVHRSPELAYVEDLVKQLTAFGLLTPASGPATTMSHSRNPEVFIFPVCTSVPLVFSKSGLLAGV